MSVNSKMTALADEIRELSGTTTSKSIDTMTSDVNTANTEITEQTDLIAQIATALEGKAGSSGGVELPKLTNPASASDILSNKEAIDGNGNKITGTIATVIQATPSVSINSSGLITASATQSAGYVSAGTKSGTKQLTTQAAKTVTPTTSSQTAIASGVYTTGKITVGAIPSNYEDVTTETNAYTTKLATLETAISALETELQGKASGGSGSGANAETCDLTIIQEWGGNDDPALLRVRPLVYNLEGNTVNIIFNEVMSSESDFEAQHTLSVKIYKNIPVAILIYSINNGNSWTTSVNGGVLTQKDDYNGMSVYAFTPTENIATVTFSSL